MSAKPKKPPPSVVAAIDRAIHTLSCQASGAELGSHVDKVSRSLGRELVKARGLAEKLEGALNAAGAP